MHWWLTQWSSDPEAHIVTLEWQSLVSLHISAVTATDKENLKNIVGYIERLYSSPTYPNDIDTIATNMFLDEVEIKFKLWPTCYNDDSQHDENFHDDRLVPGENGSNSTTHTAGFYTDSLNQNNTCSIMFDYE